MLSYVDTWIVQHTMHSAQPDLSSSLLPGRNFVCPNETVAYSCSGTSLVVDWYTPPLLNESDSLRYFVTSTPGTVLPFGLPEPKIRSNLVHSLPNFLTVLTVDGSVDTDLSIICRFGNRSAAFVEASLDHNIQGEIFSLFYVASFVWLHCKNQISSFSNHFIGMFTHIC